MRTYQVTVTETRDAILFVDAETEEDARARVAESIARYGTPPDEFGLGYNVWISGAVVHGKESISWQREEENNDD